jgi:cyclic pyranopterin phosphate synthase
MTGSLTHFDDEGRSKMVDVGEKSASRRTAVASGIVQVKPETARLIRDQEICKGDVLEIARLAGIMAAKQTASLIPLCHPIRLDSVVIKFEFLDQNSSSDQIEIKIKATVSATDRTGVEMEALTSVSTAGLVIYDMCKSVDREITISNIRLEEKTGGKSGDFRRQE